MYVVEFSGTLKSLPVEGVNLMPVMVAVNAWMESWELGGGGVAVRTNETVALPPPAQFVQTLPTPLQEARTRDVKIKSTAAEICRVMDLPHSPRYSSPGALAAKTTQIHKKNLTLAIAGKNVKGKDRAQELTTEEVFSRRSFPSGTAGGGWARFLVL